MPRLLSAACAPHLAEAIIELAQCKAKYHSTPRREPQEIGEIEEASWHVQPTRLALYRDAEENLTLQAPPAIEEAIGKRGVRIHFAPVAAWHMVTVGEHWAAGNWFEIQGPAGLDLVIGPHALSLSCGLRWWSFRLEPAVQLALRRICREVVRIISSPLAIYLADGWEPIDAVMEGATIDEIVAQLHTSLGPPKPSRTMLTENVKGQATDLAYYLDTFADL